MKLALTIVICALIAFITFVACGQTPLQAQSQVYTNQFQSGPTTNAVVDGTTNRVPMQQWTVQEIEVITILRSQRTEMRVTLTNTPLLSLQTNGVKSVAYPDPVPLIGPPAPPKTPKRKPRP